MADNIQNIYYTSSPIVETQLIREITFFIRTPPPSPPSPPPYERHDSDRPLSLKLGFQQVPYLATQYGGPYLATQCGGQDSDRPLTLRL